LCIFFRYVKSYGEYSSHPLITSIDKNITISSTRLNLTIRKNIISSRTIFIVKCIYSFLCTINTKYFYEPKPMQRRFSSDTQEITRILCKPKIRRLIHTFPSPGRPYVCQSHFYVTPPPLPSQPITSGGVHQAGSKKNLPTTFPVNRIILNTIILTIFSDKYK
jgi:hypothetical protein